MRKKKGMPPADSDQQAVAEVLAGRTEAFRGLVQRHQRSVFRLARHFAAGAQDQEDLAQDVFLAAFANLSRYDASQASFATWLLRICRNKCINWSKRKRPARSHTAPEPLWEQPPDFQATAAELRRRLDDALAQLPPTQRTAFLLAEVEGLSYQQVAQIEGIGLGAVKSRIHRARGRLRAILEPLADHL